MLTQIKNAKFYCIAAVGVAFYAYTGGGTADNSLKSILSKLWGNVGSAVDKAK